jgi:hypothetical protein
MVGRTHQQVLTWLGQLPNYMTSMKSRFDLMIQKEIKAPWGSRYELMVQISLDSDNYKQVFGLGQHNVFILNHKADL